MYQPIKEATYATVALLEHGLIDVVLEQDPLSNETIWHALRERVWWYGNTGGIAAFAISALDMALWDLKGKILGMPLYQLLGGKQHERLPVCVSTHPKASEIEAMAAELAGFIQQGYQLVKVGFGEKRTCQSGDQRRAGYCFCQSCASRHRTTGRFYYRYWGKVHWDLPYAVRMAQALNEINLTWLEFSRKECSTISPCARPFPA